MTSTVHRSIERVCPWADLAAAQQPRWDGHPAYASAVAMLAVADPLVSIAEIDRLHNALARVSAGHACVLQVGDCVERFDECSAEHVDAKLSMLDHLAARLQRRRGLEVVRVGRLAGQFAKPRSSGTEVVGDITIPVFRGHLVNSEAPHPAARSHDPTRLLRGYEAAANAMRRLTVRRRGPIAFAGPWSSHEALVLDYECALVRTNPATGRVYLGSTHYPWIGERTRQTGGAHVAFAATVMNPVACKLGPTAVPEHVVRLCSLLDPHRQPGRLTLIVRMGCTWIGTFLPPIVRAVRRAGHPVVWLVDPMHGNTVRTRTGQKTRYLPDVVAEVRAFHRIIERHGQHPGGFHLEVAATDVTECVGGSVPDEAALRRRYTTLCDPRLSPDQALSLIDSL